MKPPTYPMVRSSVPGRYFVDESCIYCELCVALAPGNFAYVSDGGFACVSKQPSTETELDQVAEALEACPTESIGDRDNPKPNFMDHLSLRRQVWEKTRQWMSGHVR